MNQPPQQALPPQTTIAGLFESNFQFAIPSYQRAYSWGKTERTQFLQDLKDQPPGKPYFLGHFLFERNGGAAEFQGLLVIDGQQRLTTVVIFFSCLLREMERRGESVLDAVDAALSMESLRARYLQGPEGNRLKTVPYDNTFFNRLIIEGLEDSMEEDIPRSQKQIRDAREYFTKELRQADSPAMLTAWCQTIQTAVVTTFEVPGKVQATQIFAFQNDRGKDLTDLEKLKAFLMHMVYLHSASRGEEDAISEIEHHFSAIYELTEKLKTLKEDQVLNHHSTAFLRGWEPAFNNIKDELKAEPEPVRVKWIKDFCHNLHESFLNVAEIEREAERNCAFADVLILDGQNSCSAFTKVKSIWLRFSVCSGSWKSHFSKRNTVPVDTEPMPSLGWPRLIKETLKH